MMALSVANQPAFPRGKKKRDQSKNQGESSVNTKVRPAPEEDLFRTKDSSSSSSSKKKKAKKRKQQIKDKDESGDAQNPRFLSSVEPLSYRQLDKGMVLLGCVSSVGEYELRVSLPGHLVGTVPATSISKPYTEALRRIAQGEEEVGVRPLSEMFKVGQPVSCAVEKADCNEDGFYKVRLSLDPRLVQASLTASGVKSGAVLQAAVASAEDHGFVMDVGVAGIRAFLPHKRAERFVAQVLGGQAPGVGQVMPVVVTKTEAAGGSTLLTCDPKKLLATLADPEETSIPSMIPGTCFRCRVVKELGGGSGIRVSFGPFAGYVHRDHFSEEVEEDQELEATVLYVTPTVNTVHLSCKRHLKFGRAPALGHLEEVPLSHIAKSAEVLHSSRSGLVVKLAEDSSIPVGFVSARQVSDGDIPDVKEKYPAGTSVTCRVIQFDHADAMYICSMQKSVLSQTAALASGQLKPGDKVTCQAKRFVEGKGLVVEVAKNREAFIPMTHLTDVPLKNPQKKFPPGTKLKCRVLRSDPERRRLHLTNKTILVKEEYPVVGSYSEEVVGQQTEGVVVKVRDDGLLLELFNDVRGWVPKSKMSEEPIEYPERLFFVGQVLKCQVLDADVERRRMTLSLILGGKNKPMGHKQRKEGEKVKLGLFYDCTVMDKSGDGLSVEVEVDGVVTKAFLPKGHLTDHAELAEGLMESYSVGDVIKDVLCYERDVVPVLTAKSVIRDAVRSDSSLPKSFSDLFVGSVLPAVVCAVKPYGAFLRLPTWKFRKSALVPTRFLSDDFVDDVKDFVSMHQTVYCKVVERDEEEEKVTMSMRMRDLNDDSDGGVALLSSFLEESEKTAKAKGGRLSVFHPGLVLSATVKQVTELGLEVDVQGVRGIITNAGLEGLLNRPAEGETLSCAALFIDSDFGCLELSANPEVVRAASKAKRKAKAVKKALESDSAAKAAVVLVKTELGYATLCIKSGPLTGRFVHVPTRRHLNDRGEGEAGRFVVGDVHSVVLEAEVKGKGELIGTLEKKGRNKRGMAEKRPKEEAGRKRNASSESEPPGRKRSRKDSGASSQEDEDAQEVKEEEMEQDEEAPDVKPDPGWEEDFDPWSNEEKPRNDEDAENEDESAASASKKKLKTHISKREKKMLDRLEAEEIARAEQRVLDGEEAEPETAEEFDRLVLSSPDSSLCWIKYIAFHAGRKESGKAREVAKRALEKIGFREGEERLNVYMAWLNLESSLGDEESAEGVLQEALKYNDQYKVYSRAAAAFEQGGNKERAEALYKTLAKKFRRESEAWVLLGTHYFRSGDLKEARFTLQRAVQNLDRKDHVGVTVKFGLLEFKLGEAERGKTVFETVLGNFPGRTDLWSVYADALVKAGEAEAARAVFERMVSLRLQPKKMKFFFKKYLAFEEEHGDQQGADRVRKKALEYVEGTVGLSDQIKVEPGME